LYYLSDFMNEFLIPSSQTTGIIKPGHLAWRSPSNIAIVKYWGKYGRQIPANPSLSMTLEHACTETHMFYKPRGNQEAEPILYFFNNERNTSFESKVIKVIEGWKEYFPFVDQLILEFHSKNTFPHSAGLASSASSMSALALCLVSLEQEIYKRFTDKDFFLKASFVARLASGSACRSVYPCFAIWGLNEGILDSSDAYAIACERFDPVFASMHDDIVMVSSDEKLVSSTAGHALMNEHPFAESRYTQARGHVKELFQVLISGDIHRFGEIAESEAMTLHALMMCSKPSYTLLLPNTLMVLHKIKSFRRDTGLPVYFSLDAGPNPHILYPAHIKDAVTSFLKSDILPLAENGTILHDHCGKGPVQFS